MSTRRRLMRLRRHDGALHDVLLDRDEPLVPVDVAPLQGNQFGEAHTVRRAQSTPGKQRPKRRSAVVTSKAAGAVSSGWIWVASSSPRRRYLPNEGLGSHSAAHPRSACERRAESSVKRDADGVAHKRNGLGDLRKIPAILAAQRSVIFRAAALQRAGRGKSGGESCVFVFRE